MKTVIGSAVGEESRGRMKNGKLTSMDVWQVWILTLECGHVEKRMKNGEHAPAHCKCHACEKAGQAAGAAL